MKKILSFLFAFFLSVSLAFADTRTDNFTRANSADVGTCYDNSYLGGGNMDIVSNTALSMSYGDKFEAYNCYIPGPNQFVQAKVILVDNDPSIVYLTLRGQPIGTDTFYFAEIRRDNQHSSIYSVVNGAINLVVTETASAWVTGDTVLFTAIADRVSMYRNGVQILNGTDSTVASGRTGIGAGANTGGTTGVDDFVLGDMPTRTRRVSTH